MNKTIEVDNDLDLVVEEQPSKHNEFVDTTCSVCGDNYFMCQRFYYCLHCGNTYCDR